MTAQMLFCRKSLSSTCGLAVGGAEFQLEAKDKLIKSNFFWEKTKQKKNIIFREIQERRLFCIFGYSTGKMIHAPFPRLKRTIRKKKTSLGNKYPGRTFLKPRSYYNSWNWLSEQNRVRWSNSFEPLEMWTISSEMDFCYEKQKINTFLVSLFSIHLLHELNHGNSLSGTKCFPTKMLRQSIQLFLRIILFSFLSFIGFH